MADELETLLDRQIVQVCMGTKPRDYGATVLRPTRTRRLTGEISEVSQHIFLVFGENRVDGGHDEH